MRSSLSDAETKRFDIEFVFEAMEQFVADRAVISESDQSQPLSRYGLMPQASEGVSGFERALRIDGSGLGVTLKTSTIMETQPLKLFRHEPVLIRELIQPGQRRGGRALARQSVFLFVPSVLLESEGPNQRSQ